MLLVHFGLRELGQDGARLLQLTSSSMQDWSLLRHNPALQLPKGGRERKGVREDKHHIIDMGTSSAGIICLSTSESAQQWLVSLNSMEDTIHHSHLNRVGYYSTPYQAI